MIRDGWGISPNGKAAAEKEGNATLLANTPFHDQLYKTYPMGTLSGSGEDVGLPEGQMGNSEVGHLNLGAGRIVYQDLTRINKAIRENELASNTELVRFFETLKKGGGALHFFGLLSDGGVHSHQEHLHALLEIAHKAGIKKLMVHAFMDGRDTSPTGGAEYLSKLSAFIAKLGAGEIATVVGRFYAMDRDKRWERTQKAYELVVNGTGEVHTDPVAAIRKYYKEVNTGEMKGDEFAPAMVFNTSRKPLIQDGDGILFFNFRSDRARQLSEAFLLPDFQGFPRSTVPKVHYLCMTEYNKNYKAPIMFGPQSMKNIFSEVVSAAGLTQLRMAETEKYPHVTYFFNGGVEAPYPGEERLVTPSPKDVKTYDLKPQMSALELTESVLAQLDTGKFNVIILNFANPDMVGHTGSLPAAIKAVETIDACAKRVIEKVLSMGGKMLITADHGNCEQMLNPDGSPHTAHTTNLVHVLYVAPDSSSYDVGSGILADVAPTLLDMLGVAKPAEMTGVTLLKPKK